MQPLRIPDPLPRLINQPPLQIEITFPPADQPTAERWPALIVKSVPPIPLFTKLTSEKFILNNIGSLLCTASRPGSVRMKLQLSTTIQGMRVNQINKGCPRREKKQERWVWPAPYLGASQDPPQGGWVGFLKSLVSAGHLESGASCHGMLCLLCALATATTTFAGGVLYNLTPAAPSPKSP